jgi:hypothetical protein
MEEIPKEKDLKQLFYERIRKAPALAEDLAHYDRQETKDQSYEYLRERVRKAIERHRAEKNRAEIRKSLGNDNFAPAAPAPNLGLRPKARAKGKAKAKAKPRASSAGRSNDACRAWAATGSCPRGDSCIYTHGKKGGGGGNANRRASSAGHAGARSTAPKGLCHFFVKGTCKNGTGCAWQHGEVAAPAPARAKAKAKPKGKAAAKPKAKSGNA